MEEIHKITELEELENYLEKFQDKNTLREKLFLEFLKYANYKNVSEWNKAVRLCESLAIIGWGNYEPLEATKGVFFNGNPETTFKNKFGESRFVDAIWSKRKTGFTMEQGRTSYHFSPNQNEKETILWVYETIENIEDLKIETQRNWVPKNPIFITRRISNCYKNSEQLIESIKNDLQIRLIKSMQPEEYGRIINRIIISCSFSYYDNDSCKCNHIILESDKKISTTKAYQELQKIYSKQEIEKNGYYLRNRFEYGRLNSKTGTYKLNINFEKEFSDLNFKEQKEKFSKLLIFGLNTVISKLKKKKLDYNFELLKSDYEKIINQWNVE